MVLVAGLLLALLGAFHVASRPALPRLPLAGRRAGGGRGQPRARPARRLGPEGRGGAAVAFLGWIVGVGIVTFGGSNDVVIGGSPGDWVPLGFLVAGAVAGVVAVVLAMRFLDPGLRPPPPTYGVDPGSSLRASGRR